MRLTGLVRTDSSPVSSFFNLKWIIIILKLSVPKVKFFFEDMMLPKSCMILLIAWFVILGNLEF